MLYELEAESPTQWNQVEERFLRAMESFDSGVAAGEATQGERQNGKGDFFNDLLAILLENCAGVALRSRRGVPGLIFRQHNLDVTYPAEGQIMFNLEAKATGTPIHPGNQTSQKNPLGRGGSADLDKRVKETGFKAIDMKSEFARVNSLGSPGRSLTDWLGNMEPQCYLFIAARVTSKADFKSVLHHADLAAQVLDRVGVYCFEPRTRSEPTTYRQAKVTSTSFELDRVLDAACSYIQRISS